MDFEEVLEMQQTGENNEVTTVNIQETVNTTITSNKKKVFTKNKIFLLFSSILFLCVIILSSLLYVCKNSEKRASVNEASAITVIKSFEIPFPSLQKDIVIEQVINSVVGKMKNNTENIGYEWFMEKTNDLYTGGSVIERYTSFDSFINSANVSSYWNTLHKTENMLVFNIDGHQSTKLLKEYPFASYTGTINYGVFPCLEKGRQTTSDLLTVVYKFGIFEPSKTSDESIDSIVSNNVKKSLEEPGTIGYEWYLNKNEFGNYKEGYILERYSSFGAFLPGHEPPGDPWKTLQVPTQIQMFNIPLYGKYILKEGGWEPYITYMGSGMRYFGYSVCRW